MLLAVVGSWAFSTTAAPLNPEDAAGHIVGKPPRSAAWWPPPNTRSPNRKAGTQARTASRGPHAHRRRVAPVPARARSREHRAKAHLYAANAVLCPQRAVRLCMDALRAAEGALMTTEQIAEQVMELKGFDAGDAALRKAIGEQCLALMRSFRKQGTVEQIGLGRGVRWKSRMNRAPAL
jgi:hypothetical protein